MYNRSLRLFGALFIAVDQLAHVLLWGGWYLVLGGKLPNPTHTISYTVGKSARGGNRLAAAAQVVIDKIFCERDHCQRCVDRNDRYHDLTED